MLKDLLCDEFQETVNQYLIRHRSIIDVISKLQETAARTNRAVSKAVTGCGCIKINASKQRVPEDISIQELREYMDSHVEGSLCEHCKDIIETEIGTNLFYMAALCNLLDLNLYDILIKEHQRISTLGIFNFF